MAKGWGVCTSHGGGCGAQDGEAADDCQLVEPVIPGKGVKPAGLPIPLLNGANEAPTEFPVGVLLGVTPDNGCSGEGNSEPGEDFARESEYEPGSSNCLNRSRSASCSGVGAAGWGGRPSDLNQSAPLLPFCPANWLLAGRSLKKRSKICAAVGNPMRTESDGLPFVNPLWRREKSQSDEELPLVYSLATAVCVCCCRSKKRSTTVKFS